MSSPGPEQSTAKVEPKPRRAAQTGTDKKPSADKKPQRQPRYHVVLWDDDEHTYDYVIRMMQKLFGHPQAKGLQIATQVDTLGRAICLTTTREHAELKRDQILAFGRDVLMDKSRGSMRASIEPSTE